MTPTYLLTPPEMHHGAILRMAKAVFGVEVTITIGKAAADPLETPEDEMLWSIGEAGKAPILAFYPEHQTETLSVFTEVHTPATYWEPGDVELKCIGHGHGWGSALRAGLLAYTEEMLDGAFEDMGEAEADAKIAEYADEIANLRRF